MSKEEENFIHPLVEIVVDEKGNQSARLINISKDRVEDYINGKTSCIMTDDGVPLGKARQEAYMKQLKYAADVIKKHHES